ncbi:MAG TPA: adenylyl-sulfate kinase [Solirubrobacteraceae bacterium]|nr:adenylyl-sulfate kinase [Solirubrobacteraceae bacterium]
MGAELTEQHTLDRARRWAALGQRGATIWFTGLPAAGKSTIAAAVEARLVDSGRGAYWLDGDNLRDSVCGDLGFSREDRQINVGRVGELARMFADAGMVSLVSLVSPYADCRDKVRKLHEHDGLVFLEVFVNTPASECARRDPKGLYARANSGELRGLTGVDDPYEPPLAPELELTAGMSVAAGVEVVLAKLESALT